MKNYPIEDLTILEQKVFTSITDTCLGGDYSAWAEDIAIDTELDIRSVVGILGSLVKKGLISTVGRNLDSIGVKSDILPIFDGESLSFANEDGQVSDEGMILAEKVANFKF